MKVVEPGQIHSALAYYWDHAEEINQDIERRLKQVKHTRQMVKPSPLMARLRQWQLSFT